MQEILIYILVFSAVLSLAYCFVTIIQSVQQERAELRGAELSARLQKSRFGRFIDEQRLSQLRVTLGISMGGVMACVLLFFRVESIPIVAGVGIVVGIVGYMIPVWYYSFLLYKRSKMIEEQLLTLIVGIHGGIQAGQATPQSLASTVKRIENPIREEMQAVLRDYNLGVPLADSLENVYNRYRHEDLLLLITSIRLSSKTGGKLSDILKQLIEMIRARRQFKRKLDALTAESRYEAIVLALAPSFAFVLFYLVQEDLMVPMVTTTIGWCAIGLVHVMELIAFFWIKKILTIRV